MTQKQHLRADLQTRRRQADPARGIRLAGHLLTTRPPPPGAAIGGFWPLPTEIDIRPLLLALLGRGHQVLLPETPPVGQPLVFRHWRPGATMIPGRFNTHHPDTPPATPDLLLVPLLGFDAACNRIGYGAGYYDRTIAALPGIPTIGCAFALQQVDAVPVLPHDRPLNAIATENGVIFRPET